MKTLNKTFGIIAAAALVVVMTGCIAATTIPNSYDYDRYGLFTGPDSAKAATSDSTELAKYYQVMGLFDLDYEVYATKCKEAAANGKKITIKRVILPFVTINTAYAK